MYDAKHAENRDIEVILTETESGYSLTLEPSKDWLNSPDRQYPVVIDPIVNTSLAKSRIHDTWVMSGLPTENRDNSVLLGVGYGTISKVTRTYAKFDLPPLSSGDMVTSAQFSSCLYTTQPDVRQINVHKVISDSYLDSTQKTWEHKPAYNPKIEDYAMVTGTAGTFINWDVTGIVKDWYTSGNNYGLMLKQQDETIGYNEFYSSDTSSIYTDAHPQVSITYVNNSGLESYWTYHSQDVGRAGTGYINDYNGNLIFKHNDLSMSGSKMPVSIQHVYNSNNKKDLAIGYGNGWRLNINQKITIVRINGTDTYCYTDDDGTKHYFYYDAPTSSYKDEDGLNIILTINGDSTYTIKDKTANQLIFTSSGYLSKLIDQNGNTSTLSFNGPVLTQITDGAGRITVLDSDQGTLLGITDPAGRRTSFSYTAAGNLATISYPDEKQTTYNYDANFNLTGAVNYDGYNITYAYGSGEVQRVVNALESHIDGTLGQQTTVAYGNNLTTFTDISGKKDTFQFNNWGNTTSTRDSQGNAQYTQYNETTKDANKNRALLESKPQKTTSNYLLNHNGESDTNWSFVNAAPSTGTGSYNTTEKYLGNRSLQVTKTNNSSRSYYEQVLNLEKGKTYTYSGYIKTNGVSNSNAQGAHLLAYYINSAGSWVETKSAYVSGTNDWERTQVTFSIPADAATTNVMVRTAIAGENGTAYFDCLQLEEGSVTNRYNLLENPDFRNGALTNWTKNVDMDGSDGLVYIDPSSDPNYTSANIDRYAFKINGVPNKYKTVYQPINVSGNAGDTFVLSGWAKGDSVPISGSRDFSLILGVKGLDGITRYTVVPFNQDSSDWQYASGVIKTDQAYQSMDVFALYYDNANTAYFDGIRLYKEDFGSSYAYDSKGNLTSAADLSKQNSSFAYNEDTNDLMTATDPKGKDFNYTYDAEHNIKTATSAQNVKYSFTYDSSGNPLTSKVGDSTLFLQSSAIYTPNENYLSTLSDPSGNTVTHNWDETKGLLNSVNDSKNTTTNYAYEASTDRLSSVSKAVSGQQITNGYTYENDRIKNITQNGFNYNFGYDSLGNNTNVSVGTQNLITNSFESRIGKLLQSTYGNGQTVSQDYDSSDRVTASKYNGVTRDTYAYDNNGNLGYKQDLVNGVQTKYQYDLANRLTKVTDNQANTTHYEYDANNNLNKLSQRLGYMTTAPDTSNLTGRFNVADTTLISLNKTVTASTEEASTVKASNAVDGNLATRWASLYTDDQWITVDLGEVTSIKRVVLNWEAAYAKGYRIEVSDNGVNGWTTVYNTTAGDGGTDDINDLNASGRYVKMTGTQRATSYGYSLWEFSVYRSNCVASSSETNNFTSDKAFDNNAQTRWSSLNSDAQWIYVDLGTAKAIKHITLDWEAAYAKSYTIQTSNDAVNWSTVYTTTSGDGETDDITGLNVSARYVKMNATQRGTTYGYSLWEFNVCGDDSITTRYEYDQDQDNRPVKTIMNSQRSSTIQYDSLGRVGNTTVDTSTPYVTGYGYLPGVNGSTTTKVGSVTNNGVGIDYTYDANGNIETITNQLGEESKVIKYYYDKLNEVIREDNQVLSKTIVNTYDVGGNITSKIEYPYSTGTLGTSTKTYNYAYGDANWKDKLTSFDGKALTYDAIGNPLTYDGWAYTWEEGRQLATMVKGATNLSFKYNDSGIRTQKTVNGVTTKYTLNGDKVTLEDNGTDKIYYTYDATGNLVSMNLNNVEYYYIRNAQGDITGLFDKTGTQVVSYSYDTWGKLLSTNGTLELTVGAKNPYLYRGYRSDSETGLYYLQSRYYNPDWGRFINADAEGGKQGQLLSHNVFAYCLNNPVNMIDPSGYEFEWALPGLFFIAPEILIGGAIVLGLIGIGYAAYQYFSAQATSGGNDSGTTSVGEASSTGGGGGGSSSSSGNAPSPKKPRKPTDSHHSWPKAIGGAAKQILVEVPIRLHREIHSVLYLFEEGWLAPKRGYKGEYIIRTFGLKAIQDGLMRFYNSEESYRIFIDPLKEAIKYTQNH